MRNFETFFNRPYFKDRSTKNVNKNIVHKSPERRKDIEIVEHENFTELIFFDKDEREMIE